MYLGSRDYVICNKLKTYQGSFIVYMNAPSFFIAFVISLIYEATSTLSASLRFINGCSSSLLYLGLWFSAFIKLERIVKNIHYSQYNYFEHCSLTTYSRNSQNVEKNVLMFAVVVDLLVQLDKVVQKQNSILDMETVQWQLLLR